MENQDIKLETLEKKLEQEKLDEAMKTEIIKIIITIGFRCLKKSYTGESIAHANISSIKRLLKAIEIYRKKTEDDEKDSIGSIFFLSLIEELECYLEINPEQNEE